MRGRTSLLTMMMVLAVVGQAMAMAPSTYLRADGNNWYGTSGDFYRFTMLEFDDGMGHVGLTYHIDDVSFQFTAGASGAVQAVRLMLGNSDVCSIQPEVTVSIQTNANGAPSGTLVGSSWSGGIGYWNGSRWITAGTYDFPVGTANIVAGQVYHIRMTCHNLVLGSGQAGGDGGAPVDFRLYTSDNWNEIRHSDPATWDWTKYKTRSYDGYLDPNLYGKIYDHWLEEWHTGAGGMPGTPEDERFKVKTPLFEMFATATPASTITGVTASDPIPGLCQGARGNSAGSQTINNNTNAGETFLARYPNARPVAQSISVRARKVMTGGVWDSDWKQWTTLPDNPNVPLTLELRAEDGTFLAKGVVDPATMPWDETTGDLGGAYTWATATLTDAAGDPIELSASLSDGERYMVIVKTEDLASGGYTIAPIHQSGTIGSSVNTFYGEDAKYMLSTNGGALWTEYPLKDMCFSLGVIIPGDANGDGLVDVGDLGILGANYGLAGNWAKADFNNDGVIDVGDMGVLGVHYGERLPVFGGPGGGGLGGGALVPEPATIGLLAMGALALIRRRRS